MGTIKTRPRSSPRELPQISDRMSFVYLERCTVHRDAGAITAEDAEGTTHIPSATIGTLLLGPGTRVTHQAMSVLGECGASVVWVGEHGVRYYAQGHGLTRSAALAEAHADRWANRRTRLDTARAMYRLRFPREDPAGLTRRQLLGREGDRLKECYRNEAKRTGVPWHGRHYTPGDFASGDPINQAITAAAQCMYGVAHAVSAAVGCIPALGFVHSGHAHSFILDIADLYKTEVAIPAAFDTVAEDDIDVGSRTRRALRNRIHQDRLLDRCVRDIFGLLLPDTAAAGAETATSLSTDSVKLRTRRRSTRRPQPRRGPHLVTVIVLTNCPAALRGFLTRWLLEISPGVFIGRPSARIRDLLWDEVTQYSGKGRALLAHTADTEQGFTFRTHDHAWHPTDHEGLTLINRPKPRLSPKPPPTTGWSKAAKRRRFGGGPK